MDKLSNLDLSTLSVNEILNGMCGEETKTPEEEL
jgi:hypothetical protein